MAFTFDPMYALNTMLCAAILVLGYLGYRKSVNKTSLYVGIAFGLFGISNLAILLGYKTEMENVLIVVRTLAYLVVLFALYKLNTVQDSSKGTAK